MKNYKEELTRAMIMLGQHPDTIFLGQSCTYEGTAMFGTLKDVPLDKRLEMPVTEEFQMGLTNGLALNNQIPISIFPRWNFLLLAVNQVVNHLDKIPEYSDYRPKVIIRTSIGSKFPLHPQHQHIGDFTEAFKKMCNTIEVIRLDRSEDVFPSYQKALERMDGKSTLLVEWGDAYDPDWTIDKY